MYSLWRGGKPLGRFDERGPVTHHGRRAGAFGILLPSEEMEACSSIMQVRVEIFPHSPVFQNALPIEWIGGPPEPRTPLHPRSAALKPLSPEAARGVSADNVYEIRDGGGARVDVQMLTLRLCRFANASDAKKWRDEDGITGNAVEFWMVTFSSPLPNEESKPTESPSSLDE